MPTTLHRPYPAFQMIRKLKEVVTVFSAWFGSYIDLLSEFNQRSNERLKKIEKDLLLIKF
ncbi:MAG: hypothetical protein ACW99G_23090 [Candidatus Thorarchaeota archaeon]